MSCSLAFSAFYTTLGRANCLRHIGVRDTLKSGHEREIPLTPRLKAELEQAAKVPHHPMDPLLLAKLESDSHKFHSLRHYFVTQLFKAGVGAPTVRDLAGHGIVRNGQVFALGRGSARRGDRRTRPAGIVVGGRRATDEQQRPGKGSVWR